MPARASKQRTIDHHLIQLTSLDKLYWPDDALTKGDALDYYERVARTILPYLRNRPVTLRAYPNGIDGPGFWRRDLPDNAPDWLASVAYQPETREDAIEVPVIDNEAGLIWYLNQSSIEIHQWMSLADDLEHPDWAVFDLDPGEGVGFDRVLDAALLVRDELGQAGLKSFPKTSGATGMHVFAPIDRVHSYYLVREWVHDVARALEARHPARIAAASGGTHAGDVVTIDHAQNSIARNTAAPYTLRVRPGAPVSTPVSWDEVESGKIRPSQFTLRTVPERLKRIGDPWKNARRLRQRLPVDS